MARLFTSGFELNSMTAGHEWTTTGSTGASIATGAKRSGTYGLKVLNPTSGVRGGTGQDLSASSNLTTLFARFYLNIQTLPNVAASVFGFLQTAGSLSVQDFVRLETSGALTWLVGGTAGIASSPLSTNTWYRVEVKYDSSGGAGAHVAEMKIDGSVIGTLTGQTFTRANELACAVGNVGGSATTTGEWWIDDVAVNDTSGSAQTSYPGEGSVVMARPNAAGDSTILVKGGSSPAATNWQSVNESPPDDGVTFVGRVTGSASTQTDDYNVSDPVSDLGMKASDTVTLVQLSMRGGSNNASLIAARQYTYRLKSASGGTVLTSSAIGFNINGWTTNGTTAPKLPQLTSYSINNGTGAPLTDNSGIPWPVQGTNSLTNLQIGMQNGQTSSASQTCQITAVWLTIDFVPGPLTATITDNLGLTDTASQESAFAHTQTDALGLTDTALPQSNGLNISVTIADPFGMSDVVPRALTATITDHLGATDNGHALTSSLERIGFTDNVRVSIGKNQTFTNSLGMADLVTEVATGPSNLTFSQSDRAGLTDSITVAIGQGLTATITDSFGLTDAVFNLASIVADMLTMQDFIIVNLHRAALYFRPPAEDLVSNVAFDVPPIWNRLMRYYPTRKRGVAIWKLPDGTYTTDQPYPTILDDQQNRDTLFPATPTPPSGLGTSTSNLIEVTYELVYLGGHVYPIDDDEADRLTAAGFGAGISSQPPP